MAIHAHSTTAPAVHPPGLLRSAGAPCRVLSHGEMLALIEGERPELPPEPILGADTPQPVAGGICATVAQNSDHLTSFGGAPLPSLTSAFAQRRAVFGPFDLREDRIRAEGYLADDLSAEARREIRASIEGRV